MEEGYRKLHKIELAGDDFKENGLRLRVVKLWFTPDEYTCLTVEQLKLILKYWIIGEEEKYPQPKYQGRWMLFDEIKKVFDEVKINEKGGIKMKIHCEEMAKEGFDKIPIEEVQRMVGWVEPPEKDDTTWDVTTSDDGIFTCSNQENATILAGIEEIKAMLMRK